ncbi:5E5 antigen-like, partial [Leptonychotes weddellii]|uniref:5E5 antigen-like n=1 Tax=Leptonychotes weddellii TaxID=9713 RepID=A0A2U3Z8I1_LEPWE
MREGGSAKGPTSWALAVPDVEQVGRRKFNRFPSISHAAPCSVEPSGKERRGLGQPGCEEAAAQGASGTGGSGAGSGGAEARRTNRRGHQPGVSALEFDIHLSRVYPPPFFLQQFLKSTFFLVLIYFLLPTPRLNRADCLGRLLLYFPKSLRILETSREKKEVARAPERSRGRERETGSESARERASNDRDRGKVSDLLLGVTARARREPSPSGSRIGPAALTDRQTDTAPRPSSHLLPGRRPRVDAAASRGQEPEPAPGGGVEGVGARGVAVKLFVQLLGCSRSGGAVVRAGAAEPSGTGRSASSGREEPQSEEGEEEEEKEEERGPRWRLGARKPGSWTGEAAVCADSAPAARAPQALARASARGGRGDRLGAEESGPPRSPSRRGSASRAGSGRASETMNFLLSWVHWSLALLLYLHHAK